MFSDYLVPEYEEDENDLMVKKIDDKIPIIVFGCGKGGMDVTTLLNAYNKHVDLYCEGNGYWYEGKKFLERDVVTVDSVIDRFVCGNIIIAATGLEVIEIVNNTFENNGNWKIFSFVDRRQHYEMNYDWVSRHINELEKVFNLFKDDISINTFLSYIGVVANCVKREKVTPLVSLWKSKQYFNDLYPKEMFREHIMIDCGAWIGDTAEGFIKYIGYPADNVLVRAFEMDHNNYERLLSVAQKYTNIDCYHCGVGEKHETLYFESHSDASVIVDYPTENKIEIFAVDELLTDDKGGASFVKMDLEGYERKALLGMRRLIQHNMPMLAICVYHRIDDLIAIPEIIMEIERSGELTDRIGYKYYLRHHSHNAAELVLYAVPYYKQ